VRIVVITAFIFLTDFDFPLVNILSDGLLVAVYDFIGSTKLQRSEYFFKEKNSWTKMLTKNVYSARQMRERRQLRNKWEVYHRSPPIFVKIARILHEVLQKSRETKNAS